MKYYTYVEPSEENTPVYVTMPEDKIIESYRHYLLTKHHLSNVTDEAILDEWRVINWAWKSDINGNPVSDDLNGNI